MTHSHNGTIEIDSTVIGPWWLRLGTEAPRPIHACAAADCAIEEIAATDVYCRTHETFLSWGPRPPRIWYKPAIWALRFVIAGGFFFTAFLDSMLPVWGVGVISGLAIAALPLRLYNLNARFAIGYWLAAAALGLELWYGYFTSTAVLLTWVAYIGLIGWWAFMALVANDGGGRAGASSADRGGQVVAVTMTVALPALAASAVRSEWREVCLILAVGGVSGALLVAVIIGVLRGGRPLDGTAPPQLSYLSRPGVFRWQPHFARPEQDRASGPIERLAGGVLNFLQAVFTVSVTGAGKLATLGRLVGFAAVISAIAVVNWVLWISIEASRRILGSIVATALVCWAGGRIVWASLGRSVRVVVVPLVFAATAAVTITWWSEAVRRYMADGGIVTLAWIGAGVLAAAVAFTLIWTALCGQPLAVSLRSGAHSANIAATMGVLVLAASAGGFGLLGTVLGVGPIRWGPLTAGVLILLVTATGIHLATGIHFAARLKRRAPEAEGRTDRHRAERSEATEERLANSEAADEVKA